MNDGMLFEFAINSARCGRLQQLFEFYYGDYESVKALRVPVKVMIKDLLMDDQNWREVCIHQVQPWIRELQALGY